MWIGRRVGGVVCKIDSLALLHDFLSKSLLSARGAQERSLRASGASVLTRRAGDANRCVCNPHKGF